MNRPLAEDDDHGGMLHGHFTALAIRHMTHRFRNHHVAFHFDHCGHPCPHGRRETGPAAEIALMAFYDSGARAVRLERAKPMSWHASRTT